MNNDIKANLLTNKVAIVSGGSRGIGRAICRTFTANGAKVAFIYKKSVHQANELIEELKKQNYCIQGFQGSVTDKDFLDRVIKDVLDEWGRIDILVNNAGIIRDKALFLMSEKDWDVVLDTNLKGVYLLSRAVIGTMMRQQAGRIINITSLSALMGREGQTNYSAAKAGLIGFTRSLARETARYNILVNAIAAGLIDTVMTKQLPRKMLEKLLEMNPLGRTGKPEEIAHICLFLASDLCTYMTGAVLNATGGEYM